MEDKITLAIELIKQVNDFKKEHKDIFKEVAEMRKCIKSVKEEILALMPEDQDEVTYNDFTFTRKTKRGLQHNMELLDEVINQEGSVEDYVKRVSFDREFITHKRQKTS